MKLGITLVALLLLLLPVQALGQGIQKQISKSTIVICKDTTFERIYPLAVGLGHGRQFLLCKGVKVKYSDTLYYSHNDTFILLEYAELEITHVRKPMGPNLEFRAAPDSKIVLDSTAVSTVVYCDSSVTVVSNNTWTQRSNWDTLSGGEYFDFTPWGGKNPCCNANTTRAQSLEISVRGSLFPNPARASVTLSISDFPDREFHVSVMDMNGKAICKTTAKHGSVLSFPNDLAPGIYYVEILAKDVKMGERLVVE